MWAWEFGEFLNVLDPHHQLVKDNEFGEPSDPSSIYE
jgi:hypothetical protein